MNKRLLASMDLLILILILFFLGACSTRDAASSAGSPTQSPATGSPAATAATGAIPPTGDALNCIPQKAKREKARVVDVVDGDTIKVEMNGKRYRLRYIGVDAPESVKPDSPVEFYGPEASARNKELVMGKEVTLIKDVSDVDQYDRLLRYVLVGDDFINYELVRSGYANAFTYPPDVSCNKQFRQAQSDARSQKLGLWSK